MTSIINSCIAQNILDDIEIHIFEELFNSENPISELIELNESNDTTRCWRFNNKYQLNEEIDNRPSFWPYAAGWNARARPSQKIYKYKYHPNGQLDIINETHASEGEIIMTAHQFTYPNQNTITEFYKLNLNEHLNFDFQFTQTMDGSNIIESIQRMKNYIGDSYVQTDQRLKYIYNEQLKEINHYFAVNSYPLNDEEKPIQETLGARTTYSYDQSNRLQRIITAEYTENGGQKINRDITFIYYDQSTKIEKIKLLYGENYTPREFEYIIEYEMNGNLKTIAVNDKIYKYITKR